MRDLEKRSHFNEVVALLHDGSDWITRKELSRDLITLNRRFSNEGWGFLTKTLPTLGKAFDAALSGNVPFLLPTSFAGKDASPKFLGCAVRKIFDSNGMVIEAPDTRLITWLRTFFFYSYKLEFDFSDETEKFCAAFKDVDNEIKNLDVQSIPPEQRNIMRHIIRSSLKNYRFGTPTDGPGISSNVNRLGKKAAYLPDSKVRRHFGRDLFHQPREYLHKEHFMNGKIAKKRNPLAVIFAASLAILGGSKKPDEAFYSKVLFVPKDSRGPRVIACENSHHMYAQQGVMKGLIEAIERNSMSCGLVNFADQSVNQKMTFDPRYATLDLKEASDRVSYDLVKDLFPADIFADISSCRTEFALLPNGDFIKLGKFAPMGSACCFPVMALIAFASVKASIYLKGGPVPLRNRDVFVYGDDIIVLNEYAQQAIDGLESVGLKVNTNKSFINSRFRESCGQDTFDETSVNVLRRRKRMPKATIVRTKRGKSFDVDGGYAKHTCALMNSSVDKGFLNLSIALESNLSRYLKSPIPFGTVESSYICHHVSSPEVAWRLNNLKGYSKRGKLRAYVFKDSTAKVKHTPYSRLRSSFNSNVCPITGDVQASWLNLGIRKPILQLTTLKEWWKGAYI